MRNSEDQEAFLNEGRFESSSATDRRTTLGVLLIAAITYWSFVSIAFLVNFYVAFFLTLPWSYFLLSLRMRLGAHSFLVEILNSAGGGFLAFPFLCGGLNCLLLVSAARFFRRSSNKQN